MTRETQPESAPLLPPFKAACVTGRDWSATVKACVKDLGEIPPGNTLGFLYITEALSIDLPSILAFLRQKTKVEHWVGCVGVGICGTGTEIHDGTGISVMIGAFPDDSFRILPPLDTGDEPFGDGLKDWLAATQQVFGVVHGDPHNEEAQALVARLASRTGATLAGGLTVVNTGRQHVADDPLETGLSGVLFNGDVILSAGLSQGCIPIGPEHKITECLDNLLMTLDDRPALDVLKEDMGELLARDIRRAAGFIHAAFVEPEEYLVRSLLGVDEGQGVVVVGAQPEVGLGLMFVKRDAGGAQKDLRATLKQLKKRIGGHPRGGIYIACTGRGPHIFGEDGGELALVQEVLGDTPITGFYANGEISGHRLHTFSGVLVLFA